MLADIVIVLFVLAELSGVRLIPLDGLFLK